ncbi:ECF transporter S component [Exiguobacterium flavidum]|uniref:ECF transporter S component n=1 Tax=Exiguobacterium flavidum TaxID=2184695 RepID=UPI000DF82FEC|nr:ECF transporter S component [Exiguobacterium flavidum]
MTVVWFSLPAILLAFIVLFERERLSETDLRFLALIIALAIAGRILFAGIPNVQPATALLLLLSAYRGPLQGSVAGAFVAVLSSFFLGTGTFVIFQAFAFAFVCLGVSLIPWKRRRFPLALYGLAAGYLYGWVSNIGFLALTGFSVGGFISLLVTGVFFDTLHGLSNLFFIYALHPIFLRIMRSADSIEGKE